MVLRSAVAAGQLDTTTAGVHTYTVTETSDDGFSGTAQVTYTVTAPPAVTISTSADGDTGQVSQGGSTTTAAATAPSGPATSTTTTAQITQSPVAQSMTPRVIYDVGDSGNTITWYFGARCSYPKTMLTFRTRRAVAVRLALGARVGGAWKQIGSVSIRDHAGLNKLRIAGRWHGALTPARSVRLKVQGRTGSAWRTYKTLSLTVTHTHQ